MKQLLPLVVLIVGGLVVYLIWIQNKKTAIPSTTLPTGTASPAADDAAAQAAIALANAQAAAAKARLDTLATQQTLAAQVAAGAEATAILAAAQATNDLNRIAAERVAAQALAAEQQAAMERNALAASYRASIVDVSNQLRDAQTVAIQASAIYNGAYSRIAGYQNVVNVARQSLNDILAIYNNLQTFLGFTPGKAEVQLQLTAAQAAYTAAVQRLSLAQADANSAKTAALNAITSANLIIERSLSLAGEYRVLTLVNAEATRLTQVAQATRTAISALASQLGG